MVKSPTTLLIEQRLLGGQSVSSIAREFDLSRARIHHIKNALRGYSASVIEVSSTTSVSKSCSHMKLLAIPITTPVFDALTEACAIVNRKDPEDPITVEEYAEECITTRLVELGLLRKKHRNLVEKEN